jgi:hypothetical protein
MLNTDIQATAEPIRAKIDGLDWKVLAAELDARGSTLLKGILPVATCKQLAVLYAQEGLFRSRVVMGRHGFGQGEYKYFQYPLPDAITLLREALYLKLVPVANRWTRRWASKYIFRKHTLTLLKGAMLPDNSVRLRCSCNMRKATTTASIKTSTASMYFRCKSRYCFRSLSVTFREESLYSRSSVHVCNLALR